MALVHFELLDLASRSKYLLRVKLVDRLEVCPQSGILEHREPLALVVLPEEEREDRAKAGGKYRPPDGVVRCAVEAGALHRVRALYIQIIALKLREAVDVEFEVDDAKDEANDREYRRQRIEEEPILEDTLVSLLIFQ